MIYQTIVDILHLSGKKTVEFLIAASALAVLIQRHGCFLQGLALLVAMAKQN